MTSEWGPASVPIEDGSVTLPDGRRLAYVEYGERSAPSLLLFPGSGGSRYFNPSVSREPAFPVRLFTIDRPGFGGSDSQPWRTLRDWARDVGAFANALGIDRFAVVGYSAGGPHALACGAEIPERLTKVGVVSGIAPDPRLLDDLLDEDDRRLVVAAGADPVAAVTAYLGALGEPADPTAFLNGPLPEVERRFLDDPRTRAMYEASLWEHARQGDEGDAWETLAMFGDTWGFSLGDFGVPVHVWHGLLDRFVPPAHAEYLSEHLPDAETTLWPDEGHAGLLARWPEIVAALVG